MSNEWLVGKLHNQIDEMKQEIDRLGEECRLLQIKNIGMKILLNQRYNQQYACENA